MKRVIFSPPCVDLSILHQLNLSKPKHTQINPSTKSHSSHILKEPFSCSLKQPLHSCCAVCMARFCLSSSVVVGKTHTDSWLCSLFTTWTFRTHYWRWVDQHLWLAWKPQWSGHELAQVQRDSLKYLFFHRSPCVLMYSICANVLSCVCSATPPVWCMFEW